MKSHTTRPSQATPDAAPGLVPWMAHAAGLPPEQDAVLLRARAFAEPFLANQTLDSGENTLAHAQATAHIVHSLGGSIAMQASCYLVYACEHLNKPQEVLTQTFGADLALLAVETTQLVRVQRLAWQTQMAQSHASQRAVLAQTATSQTENVRKMLLAFSRDLRVVLLRLVSRLQTLRHFATTKLPVLPALAHESLQVFAPLANRLGIWQIKWELEDLSFRFIEPDTYRQVARLLDEKRLEREAYVALLCEQFQTQLRQQGMNAWVQGRPKHIYSIVKKMRGKSLGFDQVYDIRALRIVTQSIPDCYAALSWVHSQFTPLPGEFDDYIAKPKPNGYQSLHTVVQDRFGLPIEVQLRTQAMHEHAENGVAAHWAYKEAGVKGYAGISASSAYDAKIAVLRQLLAWQKDLSEAVSHGALDERIYVLTPDAAIVELPRGATALDFAYSVHTDLGHRCRGARLDGVMTALNTALQNGQTVEVIAAKEGGPSRDWLNAELGYLASHRARAKVRAWFNALALHETIAKGREAVEKLLQREGKTAIKLEDLAARLGFNAADKLFEVVGKDEFSLRNIEILLHPPAVALAEDAKTPLRKASKESQLGKGGLLVGGVQSLMTQLARCCKPAAPDPIVGFVTRGKGVSVHRANCSNVREMLVQQGPRLIEVQWGPEQAGAAFVYRVDVRVEALDRPGLLRDISEILVKEKMNLVGVQTRTAKDLSLMLLTVEVPNASGLSKVLAALSALNGVRLARRR